jgi:hypothetical protein
VVTIQQRSQPEERQDLKMKKKSPPKENFASEALVKTRIQDKDGDQ